MPADLRLVESVNLRIDESSLTGESVAVEKRAADVLDADIPLGDRRNLASMGTVVTAGRGRGLVVATGMRTEIGRIADLLQTVETTDTPLAQRLARLGRLLGSLCIAICLLVFVWGLFRDAALATLAERGLGDYLAANKTIIVELFMTAVSLAIAAVPEGLPAVVTLCLALGMQRMIQRHALIRRLPAVETLGCATVICTDKTGTLTQNAMTVVAAVANGRRLRVTGEGYAPAGGFFDGETAVAPHADAGLLLLLTGAAACNDAHLVHNDSAAWQIVGDPTEGALITVAAKAGVETAALAGTLPRIGEHGFDAERKRMTTFHRNDAGLALDARVSPVIAFVKGAPDLVLALCTQHLVDGDVQRLDASARARILDEIRALSGAALRVLAVAARPFDAQPAGVEAVDTERDLVFVGLLGMIDPPRPEAIAALAAARAAGIRSVMVTGDYRETAEAIAHSIGLTRANGLVLSGAELDRMDDAALAACVDRLAVCARVSPQHKTRIVAALQARGEVVAMTGDGVNDAPALKRADIGVAMGVTGTDVARETADMVLTDDNFASIVAAVEQGRIIYANIRKFVYFLLACNIGEILIVAGAMFCGLPLPLKPVQLLWLNLVSDGAPALALGLERGDPDVMQRPPRPPSEPVVDRRMALGIAVVAVVDALAILAVFALALQRYPGDLAHAQTIAFVTLCSSELIRAFAARSERHSVFALGVFSNRWMVWAVGASLALVLALVYLPPLQPLLGTAPLTAADWLLMLPFLFAAPAAMELFKRFAR